jgi:hypothetical protein
MIARAAPPVDEAHAPFVAAVMAALPDKPSNSDVSQAIAAVLSSPAPALESFGNSAPEPTKAKSEKFSDLNAKAEHNKAEHNKASPAASSKRRREPWGTT